LEFWCREYGWKLAKDHSITGASQRPDQAWNQTCSFWELWLKVCDPQEGTSVRRWWQWPRPQERRQNWNWEGEWGRVSITGFKNSVGRIPRACVCVCVCKYVTRV
jgi:hypothetical protein